MNIIRLSETTSTNNALKAMGDTIAHGTIVNAAQQTAGRGQRGNSWESEPGKNLTFSILLKPESLAASCQFAISCMVALSVARTLERYLADRPEKVAIKWPNDIYVGDRKICGILIENVITGAKISSSIAGIGVNINQKQFISDAPNPVSLVQLTGRNHNLQQILEEICELILKLFDDHINRNNIEPLFEEYKSRLWRREGFHPYREPETNRSISARIVDVKPSGHIVMEHRDATLHTYAFKEIFPII